MSTNQRSVLEGGPPADAGGGVLERARERSPAKLRGEFAEGILPPSAWCIPYVATSLTSVGDLLTQYDPHVCQISLSFLQQILPIPWSEECPALLWQ